jgi:outer membrane receptor protein involved in Fe transport
MRKMLFVLLLMGLMAPSGKAESDESVFGMTLDELMNIQIRSGTLTVTSQRKLPAAATIITREMIEYSGARNLDELLEIFVPGLQTLLNGKYDQLGIRGIISDRNTKFLLLVNGRIMNMRTANGGVSERFLSMLGDIERIEVVRGPGSAVYGPGAIAGVINIFTYTGDSFDGTEVEMRQGFYEDFANVEVRHGSRLSEDSSIFIYYGIDNYQGSDLHHAPLKYSNDFVTPDGYQVRANQVVPFETTDHESAYRDKARHKAHIHYNNGAWDTWLRYTSGGIYQFSGQLVGRTPEETLDKGFGYQQLTALTAYRMQLSDTLSLDWRLSVDMMDTGHWRGQNHAEYEYHGRVLANWKPAEQHHLAVGFEYSRESFGHRSPGFDKYYDETLINNRLRGVSPWETDAYSLLSEYQWQMRDELTCFVGVRGDKHTYTDWLISPRLALVYTPTEQGTVKLLYNRSVRRSDDSVLLEDSRASNDKDDGERTDTYELRYERQQSDHLWLAASGYYTDYDITAWSGSAQEIQDIGNTTLYGLEIEASYRSDKCWLTFSHDFTQLIDFELADDSIRIQSISAEPYGYGNDLANWSTHGTKCSIRYAWTKKWAASGSVRYLWGYPGALDMAQYNREILNNSSVPILGDTASKRAFEESVFVNLGLEYRPHKLTTLRLDALNILGWLDEDLNKRNQFWSMGEYRDDAPSIAVSVKVKL